MKFHRNVTSDEESEYSDNEDAFDDEEPNAEEASGQEESSGAEEEEEEEEEAAEAEEAEPPNDAQESDGAANSPEPQMMPSKVVKDSAGTVGGAKKGQSTKSMIEDAIRALNEPRGSSFAAIKKYITAQQDKPPAMGLLKKTLLKCINDGVLQQTKGTGCNGSFKISPLLEKAKMQAEKKKEREMEKERAKKQKIKEKEEKKAKAKKEKEEAKAKGKKMKKEKSAKPKQTPADGDTPTNSKKKEPLTKKKIQPKGTKNSADLDHEKPVPKSLKGEAKKPAKAKPKAEKASEPADDPITSTSKVAAGKKRRLAPNSSPIKKMARKSIGSLALPKTMTSKQIAKKASRVAKGRQPSAG